MFDGCDDGTDGVLLPRRRALMMASVRSRAMKTPERKRLAPTRVTGNRDELGCDESPNGATIVYMVARLRAVLLSLLVASLAAAVAAATAPRDAAAGRWCPSAGNMGTGGATATGGASSPATSGGRQVVSLPDAGTSEPDGPVVLPPECVSGTSLVCTVPVRPARRQGVHRGGQVLDLRVRRNQRRTRPRRTRPRRTAATPDTATPDTATGPPRGYRHVQAGTGRRRDDWLRMAKLGSVGDVVTDPACPPAESRATVPCTITAP